MKIRTDFVSNSSSSSFVIAIDKAYELSRFIDDLSNACSNQKSNEHDKNIIVRNKRTLDFCLNTYSLAYLGQILLKYKYEKINKTQLRNEAIDQAVSKHAKFNDRLPSFNEIDEQVDSDWQCYMRDYLCSKSPDAAEWLKEEYCHDKFDEQTQTLRHYSPTYGGTFVVGNMDMRSQYQCYHWKDQNGKTISDNDDHLIKSRVRLLIEDTKNSIYHNNMHKPQIYQITQDTLDNTRSLIQEKVKMKFESWEKLDELQARLDDNQKILCIKIADSGDGYGDYHIYREFDSDGLSKLNIEYINLDSM